LAGCERGEHVDEWNLFAFNADRDAQVEPVRLAGHRVRRHRDDERAARFPIVDRVADHLQRDIGDVGDQGLDFGGELHCVQAGQRLSAERAGRGSKPQLLQRRFEARGERLLRWQVTVIGILRPADRKAKSFAAQAVFPFPRQLEPVLVLVVGPQHQRGPCDRGRGERFVRRCDVSDVSQPRVVLGGEALRLVGGYDQRRTRERHAL